MLALTAVRKLTWLGTLAALCLAFTGTVHAQSKLQVGSAAPGLDVKKWFNGDAATIQQGKTYVVEFWATWCGPCKKSIPHLNAMHKKFADKGLIIIGVSDEGPETVSGFLTQQGDRMSYLVAADRDKNTSRAWMQAAGKNGIPCAFVVDRNSKIVYIGHPLESEFERVVTLTLSGRYDPKKEAAAQPVIEAAERAAKVKNWKQAYKHFDEVIEMDQAIFADVARRRFEMTLTEEQDVEGATAYGKKLVELYSSDSDALQLFAKDIALNPKYQDRQFDVANALAEKALQVAGPSNPEALATVALIQFHSGNVNEAIERQMQAWMIATPSEKAEYRRVLDNYRSAAERTAKTSR